MRSIYIGKPEIGYIIAGKISKGLYICIKGTYFLDVLGEMSFEEAMERTKESAIAGMEELPVFVRKYRPVWVSLGGELITMKTFLRRLQTYRMNLCKFFS